jgi:hypothetical protein
MFNDIERDYAFDEIDRHIGAIKDSQGRSPYGRTTPEDTAIAAQKTVIHIRELKRFLSRLEREANNAIRYNSGAY